MKRPALAAVSMAWITLAGLAGTTPCVAQSTFPEATPDTAVALTRDMKILDERLFGLTRIPLERWGNTFYARAMYIEDVAGPARASEMGLSTSIDSREPSVMRDSLRSTMRMRQAYTPQARTIGIIADSIEGPVREAVDGADGPPFPRRAITELEDKNGRCRRIERDYRFVSEPRGDWGLGTVVFDPPRVSRCQPRGYWPARPTMGAAPPDPALTVGYSAPGRTILAAPIVRTIAISSLDNYFSVVGEFHGKLTVFNDSIVVVFDTLYVTRRLADNGVAPRLDAIRVGVGVQSGQTWTSIDDSKPLKMNVIVPRGANVLRRNMRFVMKHERKYDDEAAWIVVTFDLTVAHAGEKNRSHKAWTYAHSEKGILNAAGVPAGR
jgi:hypothetical protein